MRVYLYVTESDSSDDAMRLTISRDENERVYAMCPPVAQPVVIKVYG